MRPDTPRSDTCHLHTSASRNRGSGVCELPDARPCRRGLKPTWRRPRPTLPAEDDAKGVIRCKNQSAAVVRAHRKFSPCSTKSFKDAVADKLQSRNASCDARRSRADRAFLEETAAAPPHVVTCRQTCAAHAHDCHDVTSCALLTRFTPAIRSSGLVGLFIEAAHVHVGRRRAFLTVHIIIRCGALSC